MKYEPQCFISYAHVDKEFVQEEIVPTLQNFGVRVWLDYQNIQTGQPIVNAIIKGIRQADFIIAIFNRRSTYLNFEIGAAIGQSKPTLAIVRDDQLVPTDISHIAFLRYSERKRELFREQLRSSVSILLDQVIDKSIRQIAEGKKVIGIRVGFEEMDLEQELRFTAEFLSLLKKVTGSKEIALLETARGSLKSFISIDFKSLAIFLEKLVFFIPEWKRKKAETLRIHAETNKIQAEADHINMTSRISEKKSRIEQADAMANLLIKYKKLGIKIQMDKDLMITLAPSGRLLIQEPKKLEDQSDL